MSPAGDDAAAVRFRQLWRVVRVAGGAGILGLLGWRFGSEPVLAAARVLDGVTLVWVVGLGALTTLFSAWRWMLVAQGLGFRIPLGGAVAEYYRSLFVNAVLPGGVLGDAHRAVRHGQAVGDVPQAAKAVVLERGAGQVVLVVAALVVLAMDRTGLGAPIRSGHPAAAWTVVAVVAAAGAIAARVLLGGRWASILLASAVVLAGHLTTFLIAARAAGATAPLLSLAPLLVLALLAMSVPFNIGGWGPREGALVWAFGSTGLNASQGLTVAVTYGLCAAAASLPGACLLITRRASGASRRPETVGEGVLQ